ncbi:MAG: ArnT family glycosyltransferase, partial [Azonexus sp.]
RQGIRLPPSGWMLAAMLALYVLAGLFGRDPWKGEDAVHIGAAWQMLSGGDWLAPMLAGRPFHEPPLYYWSAAVSGWLFGGLLPMHDALRLASGAWIALTLAGLYYAGRELHGHEHAAAAPLLLAGSVGLVLHAHDAQPMLVALAAYAGTIGGGALMARKPWLGGLFYGLSLAACLLGAGIAPTLPLLAIAPFAWYFSDQRKAAAQTLLLGLALAALLVAPWLIALDLWRPGRLPAWLNTELAPLATPFSFAGLVRFSALLPIFAFPALPLALWTLWQQRKRPAQPALLLPLILFVLTLLLLAWAYRPREIPALLLLPPLALLATPGALSLRRGAANAFDWFAMSLFSLLAVLVWVAWSAMAIGLPPRLAERVVELRPGFVGELNVWHLLLGLAVSLWWLWLILTAPRSPYRSLTHWTLGFTTFWLLATTLILPWFDYGRSYRPVAEAVAQALPERTACLAERNLSPAQRASLAYFSDLAPLDFKTSAGQRCRWLLAGGDQPAELAAPDGRWRLVWQGNRPGERREKFRLFHRD